MKAKYLVIDYDHKNRYFLNTKEEVKEKVFEALRYCQNDMDGVDQSYDFIDLETGEYIGKDIDVILHFPERS